MGLMIRYANDLRVEALLLSAGDRSMRVAIALDVDAVELVRVGESWETESGEPVEIEAMLQIPGAGWGRLASVRPRALAATAR